MIERLSEFAKDEMLRWRIPGMAIGVSSQGRGVSVGLGVRDTTTGEPVHEDTLFRIASITKPITAAALLDLANMGLLDLDNAVGEYIVDLKIGNARNERPITVRNLLQHTSGLDSELPVDLRKYGTDRSALHRAIDDYDKLLKWFAPGELWSYSNAGYCLAGAVAANAMNSTFEAAVAVMLERLGLRSTSLSVDGLPWGRVAHGHKAPPLGGSGAGTAVPIDVGDFPRARAPSGGAYSTVADLLQFARSLFMTDDPASLGRGVLALPVPAFAGCRWGLGWQILETEADGLLVGHGGSFGGYQSHLMVVPARDTAIAVLANSTRSASAIKRVCRWVLGELGGIRERPRPIVPIAEGDLANYVGRFRQPQQQIVVSVEDGGLCIDVVNFELVTNVRERLPPVHAVPIGTDSFEIKGGEADGQRFDFVRAKSGAIRYLRFGLRIAEPAL